MSQTLDLCPTGLAERSTVVFRRFDALAPGDQLDVLLDTPPWVIYHQLHTERFGEFDWQLLEPGPEQFVFRLTKRMPDG